MKYELLESPTESGTWHVEAFDDEGECISGRFSGPKAKERAQIYADAVFDEYLHRWNRRES